MYLYYCPWHIARHVANSAVEVADAVPVIIDSIPDWVIIVFCVFLLVAILIRIFDL